MDAHRAMSEQIDGQKQYNLFPDSLSLVENCLLHYPINNRGPPRAYNKYQHAFAGNNICEAIGSDASHLAGHQTFGTPTDNKQFIDAASRRLNLESMKYQSESLHQNRTLGIQTLQQVGSSVGSMSPSNSIRVPGFTKGTTSCTWNFRSNQISHPGIESNQKTVPNVNLVGIKTGYQSSMDKNAPSPLAMGEGTSKMFSHTGQPSDIATFSSRKNLSDSGTSANQQTFYQFGLLQASQASVTDPCQRQHTDYGKSMLLEYGNDTKNNQNFCITKSGHGMEFADTNLQPSHPMLPVVYATLPSVVPGRLLPSQTNMPESQLDSYLRSQSSLQLNRLFRSQAPYSSSGQQDSYDMAYHHLPSEKSSANMSSVFPPGVEHKILMSYVSFKRFTKAVGNVQIPYLKYLHSRLCGGCKCCCEWLRPLLLHFDGCEQLNCKFCGPARHLATSNSPNRKRYSDRHSHGNSVETMLPSKRTKMGSSGVCVAQTTGSYDRDVSNVHSGNTVGLCSLQQRLESPPFINSEVVQMNLQPSKDSMKDFACTSDTLSRGADNIQKSQVQRVWSFEDLGVGRSRDEIYSRGTKDFKILKFSTTPIFYGKLGIDSEKVVRCRTKVDLGHLGTKDEFIKSADSVGDNLPADEFEKVLSFGVRAACFKEVKDEFTGAVNRVGDNLPADEVEKVLSSEDPAACLKEVDVGSSEMFSMCAEDSETLRFNLVPKLAGKREAGCKKEKHGRLKVEMGSQEIENWSKGMASTVTDDSLISLAVQKTSLMTLARSPSKDLCVGHEPEGGILDESSSCGTDDQSILRLSTVAMLAENKETGSEELYHRADTDSSSHSVQDEFTVPESNGIQKNSDNSKTTCVSLVQCFTAEQIQEHLLHLRQKSNEGLPCDDEAGNKRTHLINKNACQLCSADNLLLAAPPIYCSYCGVRIKQSVIYYSSPEEQGACHFVCSRCYKNARGSIILSGIRLSKAKLLKRMNDEQQPEESWVQCDRCEGWQHQICALYNDKRDMEGKAEYICPYCCLKEIEGKSIKTPIRTALGAIDLPQTILSNSLEERLSRGLQAEREATAKITGKSIDEVRGPADLVVRVVHSADKCLKVKKQLQDYLIEENYPAEFCYKSKVILLFQNIEGVDVCLFGLYVQEYGSECPQPNQRCVYISYLDSVKYFRPERKAAYGGALRTFVYHEILIGYLEYCKKRGFTTCYLWACPPVKGEDFILYCHPETQKTPKKDKLRLWYNSMLRRASAENIVVKYTNFYDQFFVPSEQCNSKITAARLPYFDGAFWAVRAENIITDMEQISKGHTKGNLEKLMTKRSLKAMGHKSPSLAAAKDILLMQKLGQAIAPLKEDFIVVHLHFFCTNCRQAILSGWRWFCRQCKDFQLCERCHASQTDINGEETHSVNKKKHPLSKVLIDDVPSSTEDNDMIVENGLFAARNAFLNFCQRNFYQFDTLRRAKHSSMMIQHHLHDPTLPHMGSLAIL